MRDKRPGPDSEFEQENGLCYSVKQTQWKRAMPKWNQLDEVKCFRVRALPLELHLAISELWFGQEWEGILLELLCSSSIV